MKLRTRFAWAFLLAPLPAAATDYTGLATLVIGFPAVLAALASNAVHALSDRPGRVLRGVNGFATALFVLSLIFLSGDLAGMLRGPDRVAGVIYLVLSLAVGVLAVRNLKAPPGEQG